MYTHSSIYLPQLLQKVIEFNLGDINQSFYPPPATTENLPHMYYVCGKHFKCGGGTQEERVKVNNEYIGIDITSSHLIELQNS